jgi:hypothetical protein
MNLPSAIAAAGIWPALPLTGYWLLVRPQRRIWAGRLPWLTSLALMTVAGMAIWSGFLLSAAVARVYRPEYFGLAGWGVTLLSLAWLPREWGRPSHAFPRFSVWDGLLLAGLGLAAWFYLRYPTESILCGADEGIYANHAIYIVHHGRLDVPYPLGPDLEPAFVKAFKEQLHLPGLYPTRPTITLPFGHLYPVWLAQAFATAGHYGLFRLNGILALLSLAVFYGLCRAMLPGGVAVAATWFLALNPGQAWLARITLSEMLAQLFIWSGLLLLLSAGNDDSRFRARWAGAFLGLSALVRCDSLLLVPLLFLAQLALQLLANPTAKKTRPLWRALDQTALPIFAVAVAYYGLFSTPYFRALEDKLAAIGLFAGISLIALLASRRVAGETCRPVLRSRTFVVLAGVVLAGLTAYAYWVRPFLYHQDLESYSLDHLASYLSPPVVWGAVFGGWLALAALLRGREAPFLLVVLTVSAGFATLYLWRPSVLPYHFWAIRRYVPVVIPAFIFFAAFGLNWLLGKLPRLVRPGAAAVVLLFLAGFTVQADALLYRFAENRWYFSQLKELAEHLPDDELVLAYGWHERTLPLFLAFDRTVIPVDTRLRPDQARPLVAHWIADQTGKGRAVYLLCENCRFVGAENSELFQTILKRSYYESTWKPLPRKVLPELAAVHLYRITRAPVPADYLDTPLGSEGVWGVNESGFHEIERAYGQTLRWTDGEARLRVPLDPRRLPTALAVNLGVGPLGTSLRVLVNGRELFQGSLPEGPFSRTLDLSTVPLENTKVAVIELLSTTLVPPKGHEEEPLRGVQLKEIRLVRKEPP